MYLTEIFAVKVFEVMPMCRQQRLATISFSLFISLFLNKLIVQLFSEWNIYKLLKTINKK